MTRKQKILIVTAIIVISISTLLIVQIVVSDHLTKKVEDFEKLKKTWPGKYCYFVQSENSHVRDGICIYDIKDKDSLISYYERISEKFEPYVNFEFEVINKDSSIYFIEKTKEDPRIAKVFVEKRNTLNHIRYVYCKLLHDKRSNDSIQ
jgi:hypothetical protein